MAARKKIALCLEYPLALRGGVSVLVETLLAGLKEHYELVLVSPDAPGTLTGPAAASVTRQLVWNPAAVSRETSRQLARELAGAGVRLAHFHLGGVFGWGNRFHGQSPIPWTDRAGVAACSTVHSVMHLLDGHCGPQKPLWFKLAFLPVAWTAKLDDLAHVRREICVSENNAEKMRRWYWPQRGKFIRIYHSRLPSAPRAVTGAAREPIILNVGHIAWRKGQLVLAEAFARVAARHPEWKLMLVGKIMEETEAEKIRALARAHGLEARIIFAGERTDTMELMKRAGIYAQPSYYEALGLALQEAMFAGCAAVGTRAGGIPELIEPGTSGLLVETGNSGEMAGALEKLMADAPLRERYGRAGAAAIAQKGMTAEGMIKQHLELYESILQSD